MVDCPYDVSRHTDLKSILFCMTILEKYKEEKSCKVTYPTFFLKCFFFVIFWRRKQWWHIYICFKMKTKAFLRSGDQIGPSFRFSCFFQLFPASSRFFQFLPKFFPFLPAFPFFLLFSLFFPPFLPVFCWVFFLLDF